MVTWQETVGEGETPWRTVSESERENVNVVVTFEPRKLNAGFIPTASGQGHYESEEDFGQTLEQLLGVDLNQSIEIVQTRATTKVTEDRQSFARGTTGDFVFDAMSDDEGNVFIAGEQIEWGPEDPTPPTILVIWEGGPARELTRLHCWNSGRHAPGVPDSVNGNRPPYTR